MKLIPILILLLALSGWTVETDNFSELPKINVDHKFIEKSLELQYRQYIADYNAMKEMKMTEKEYWDLIEKLEFWNMMIEHYYSENTYFGNS